MWIGMSPIYKEAGFTLPELLVAVVLSATVIGGTMASYVSVIRYFKQIEDKNKGALGATAAIRLVAKMFSNASCVAPASSGDCLSFGDICATPPGAPYTYLNGRRHDDPASPAKFFSFRFDPTNKRLEYCRDADDISDTDCKAGIPWITIARDIESSTLSCDPSAQTAQVSLNAITLKDNVGATLNTREFEGKARVPFGVGL